MFLGAARVDQPAGPGKLLFTVSQLLKEGQPRVRPAFRATASAMRAVVTVVTVVTVVSLFFLGIQAESGWSYSGKPPLQDRVTRQPSALAVGLFGGLPAPCGFTCVLLSLNE